MNENESGSNGSEFIPRDHEHQLARPDEVLPDTLQLIPLASRPYFPVLVQPVVVDNDPWGEGIKIAAKSAHKLVAMSYAPAISDGVAKPDDIKEIGCVARIHRFHESEGKLQFIAQGVRRFRIKEWITRKPPYMVRVEYFDMPPVGDESQLRAHTVLRCSIYRGRLIHGTRLFGLSDGR